VEYGNPESAANAMSAMNGFNLAGRPIKVGRPDQTTSTPPSAAAATVPATANYYQQQANNPAMTMATMPAATASAAAGAPPGADVQAQAQAALAAALGRPLPPTATPTAPATQQAPFLAGGVPQPPAGQPPVLLPHAGTAVAAPTSQSARPRLFGE
jgi:hypothetical protein